MTNNSTPNGVHQKYDVMVEKVGEDRYSAHVLAWSDCMVQAATREEVIALARTAILERLAKAEIVTIDIGQTEANHSWLPFAGDWANDPWLEDYKASVEEYRRGVDAIHAPWMLEPEEDTVVTRNRRDFERVPGLLVEDWSAPSAST